MPRVEIEKLSDKRQGESSAKIRTRVMAARKRQADRFVQTSLLTNADMEPRELAYNVPLDKTSEAILRRAVQQLQLSARAHHRVLRLSRTIADLPRDERTQAAQIAEALQYRPRQLLS